MAQYDVGLSFAGEDRAYVRQVATYLRERAVRVFFDEYETVNLWGKDLYQHLAEIYRTAKYCVVFVSEAYAKKLWTRHELKVAQARAYQAQQEYILPARFDDTELPGVLSTTMYVDLRGLSPEALGALIVAKLEQLNTPPQPATTVERLEPAALGDVGPASKPWRNMARLASIRHRGTEPLDAVGRYKSVVDRLVNEGRWSYSHAVPYPAELIHAEDDLERSLSTFITDINAAVEEIQELLVKYLGRFDKLGLPTRKLHEIIMSLVEAEVATEYLMELAGPIRGGLTAEQLEQHFLYITARQALSEVVDKIRAARTAEERHDASET